MRKIIFLLFVEISFLHGHEISARCISPPLQESVLHLRKSFLGVTIKNGPITEYGTIFDRSNPKMFSKRKIQFLRRKEHKEKRAHHFPSARLQEILDSCVANGIPGVSVGIGWGKHTWFGASGVANINSAEPMTASHQIRLASVTKSLAAIVAWKLIEQHKLKMTDTVNDFLRPGLVINGGLITVAMLLNHTSGIYQDGTDQEFSKKVFADPTKTWTSHEMLKLARQHGSVFAPGTGFLYSNNGYFVLGLIERKAGRKHPDTLFQRFIGKPFKLKSTSLNYKGAFTSKKYSPGYTFSDPKALINTGNWNLSWDRVAGAGISTARDMIALSSALMEKKILRQSTLKKMWMVVPPSQTSFGFEPFPASSSFQWVSKEGRNPGTTTLWIVSPDQGYSLFMGYNFSGPNSTKMIYQSCVDIIDTLGWK